MKKNLLVLAVSLIALPTAGCFRVGVEGGEKPIHIVMDVNVRVARDLDEFFAFEEKHPTTTASQPAAAVVPTPYAEAGSAESELPHEY